MVYFIPTPIGNLDDISKRVLDCLESVETIYCEDTRVTKKLLSLLSSKYNIQFENKTFYPLHSHNEKEVIESFDIEKLKNTQVAYMSDAGMPCVSDPGSLFVDFCISNEIPYEVLSGANALLVAYAMSGFSMTEFSFFGFLPHKGKERENKLQMILEHHFISILYESPHRLLKLLEQIAKITPEKEIFLVKELTKMYQTSYKAAASELYHQLKSQSIKGEWVVVIAPSQESKEGEALSLEDIKSLSIPPKQKAKLLSKMTGKPVKEIYNSLNV